MPFPTNFSTGSPRITLPSVCLVVSATPTSVPQQPTNSLHSTRCVFLSYPSSHKGYRCLDMATQHVIVSRHVLDESVFPSVAAPLVALYADLCAVIRLLPPAARLSSSWTSRTRQSSMLAQCTFLVAPCPYFRVGLWP